MKQKRFSLIELLVVIAIIGILASIILPTLGKAREKSKKALCKSNLKQLGLSMMMYADDNNYKAPFTSRAWGGRQTYDDFLSGYDGRETLSTAQVAAALLSSNSFGEGSTNIYRCASDDSAWAYGNNTTALGRSYSITEMRTNDNNKRFLGMSHGTVTRGFNELNKASQTLLLVEFHNSRNLLGNGWNDNKRAQLYNSNDQQGNTPHNSEGNFLLTDGHVESLSTNQTLIRSNGSMASTNNISNTMWDASATRD
ncbi:prepilin-type N-terminal cleavage/methylation domain-containing protein [Lentisphaera profundi]|uniref:Prepilin-type N-terminal cleavage/methylation domain-containing protein n=1 Tax=Lentisphaera profundi TaxID=1658616 RepID=A0ABY7W000_9BACT|nr:prepilin-type N-terminal cleavage/methylation domain-containing protein [Lentisphaera profundi]WDE98864.1 prepilin-type N-terminal cleavage/methylation domain-containing protein [Lentisphaera profundi]